jgi:hypothetical protein
MIKGVNDTIKIEKLKAEFIASVVETTNQLKIMCDFLVEI